MFRDNTRKKLNEKERGAIVTLTQAGWSVRNIANHVGCGLATVSLWQNRYADTEDVKRKVGSARPRVTTLEEDQMMREAVVAKPITTAQEIAGQFFFFFSHIFI